MENYATTINIRHISSSPKARGSLSISAAAKAAIATLSYICRAEAAADFDIIGHSQGQTMIAEDAVDRAAMREMTLWSINARAKRHSDANGIRLADKIIVSLPQDATPEHHREMVRKIVSNLGQDSDAWIVAAIHRDRSGNPHAHILAIDGMETREAAKARRPDATRIRRRDALRLNEGGCRQILRQRIADQINAVSALHGYRRAEIRSLKDQGIQREAQKHKGPYGSARRKLYEDRNQLDQDGAISTQFPTRSGSSLFSKSRTAKRVVNHGGEVRHHDYR